MCSLGWMPRNPPLPPLRGELASDRLDFGGIELRGVRLQIDDAPPAETAMPAEFAERLLAWFDQHGRHDLPWQHPRTPYRVWVAEVMLQQTQVQTVIPYYQRFSWRCSLSYPRSQRRRWTMCSPPGRAWVTTLGRAICTAAAMQCVAAHGGELPDRFDALAALPGIGRSTAGAILAQAHGQRLPILDGNVRRVLARHRAVAGDPGSSEVQSELWALSQSALPHSRLADYTQALMDLGATVCTRHRPACDRCPLAADCAARLQGRVAEFPQPRSARARPLRTLAMLLLARRRPGASCCSDVRLQESGRDCGRCPKARDLGAALRTLMLPAAAAPAPMVRIRHEFTHFSLDIDVHDVAIESSSIADDQSRWCLPAEALALGLPQPVRRLLEGITRQESQLTY
jgi:A/G-specific adenine glycosylase